MSQHDQQQEELVDLYGIDPYHTGSLPLLDDNGKILWVEKPMKRTFKIAEAMEMGSLKRTEELFAMGKRCELKDAANHFDEPNLALFAKYQPDLLTSRTFDGDNILMLAARNESSTVLVSEYDAARKAGVDVLATNRDGQNLAHIVASKRDFYPEKTFDLFTALAKDGLDLNAQDRFGNTPLHIAAQRGHANQVNALLDLGARGDIVNRDMRTPASLVARGDERNAFDLTTDEGRQASERLAKTVSRSPIIGPDDVVVRPVASVQAPRQEQRPTMKR